MLGFHCDPDKFEQQPRPLGRRSAFGNSPPQPERPAWGALVTKCAGLQLHRTRAGAGDVGLHGGNGAVYVAPHRCFKKGNVLGHD